MIPDGKRFLPGRVKGVSLGLGGSIEPGGRTREDAVVRQGAALGAAVQ